MGSGAGTVHFQKVDAGVRKRLGCTHTSRCACEQAAAAAGLDCTLATSNCREPARGAAAHTHSQVRECGSARLAAPAEGVQRGKRAAIAPSPWRGVHVGVGVCTFARLGWRYPHLHVRAADTEHARKAEQRRARWFTRAGSRWCVVRAPSARLRTTPRTHRARTQRVHARVYVRVVAAAGVPGSTAMPVDAVGAPHGQRCSPACAHLATPYPARCACCV